MDRAGLPYRRRENCFTLIENVSRAQELLDAQLRAVAHIVGYQGEIISDFKDRPEGIRVKHLGAGIRIWPPPTDMC